MADREALKKLSLEELRQRLEDRGVAPFGSKGDLINALILKQPPGAASAAPPVASAAAAPVAQQEEDEDLLEELLGGDGAASGAAGGGKKDRKDRKDEKDKKAKKEKKDAAASPAASPAKKDRKDSSGKTAASPAKTDRKDKHDKDSSAKTAASAETSAAAAPAPAQDKEKKDKKENRDKKDKKDKKDRKEKKDEKGEKKAKAVGAAEAPAAPPAALPAVDGNHDKKDGDANEKDRHRKRKRHRHHRHDKQDKKEKRHKSHHESRHESSPGAVPGAAPSAGPGAQAQAAETGDVDLFEGFQGVFQATGVSAGPPGPRAAAEAEEAERRRAALREEEMKLQEEQRRQAAAQEADRRAKELGPEDEEEAQAIMAQEAAQEADNGPRRSLPLTTADVQVLRAEDARWLARVERVCRAASVTLVPVAGGGWEAKIEGSENGTARRLWLGLRCLLESMDGDAVEMRTLPEGDGDRLEVLDVPEGAAGQVVPQHLNEAGEVITAFVLEKAVVRPRPKATPEEIAIGRNLGLAVGQEVEVRFEEDWYHGKVVGFDLSSVIIEWPGTTDQAHISPIDVRPSSDREGARLVKEKPTHGRLVLIGELRARTAAKFAAMAAVDRRLIGHFAERHPPKSTGMLFGFDVSVVPLPAKDNGACARQRGKIARASEAIVEVLGRHALVAGEADERRKARAILTQLVSQAGPFGDATAIPEELADCCSMVRVPTVAVSHVTGTERGSLSQIEDDTGCLAFWLPLGTTVLAREGCGDGPILLADGVSCAVGQPVEAKWRGGSCFPAVLEENELPASEVKPAASSAPKSRDNWLSRPRVLAIVGLERGRRHCALQAMAAAEAACPGLWTSALEEAESEARDGALEAEVLCGVEAVKHDGPSTELEWFRASAGQHTMQSAATAAGCLIQMIGDVFFFGGFPGQRKGGQEYLKWACKSRHQTASVSDLRTGGALSLMEADMRDDIMIMLLKETEAVYLRPERLSAVERQTETLLLFDDGGGCALAAGNRRLLICGGLSEECRAKARKKLEALRHGGPAAQALDAQLALAASASARQVAAADFALPVKRPTEMAALPPEGGVFVAAAAPRARATRTDPRAVLKTMPWPATINEWGLKQNVIWAGHPKLERGWIRCWSRSQDSEYYLRLKDMKTTFDLSEVPLRRE